MGITGSQLAGGNSSYGRVDYDFYATDPKDTINFLKTLRRDGVTFPGNKFLEPAAGAGHIVEASKAVLPNAEWVTCDIVERGFPLTYKDDYIAHGFSERFDGIITNPPFALACEYIEKSLSILNDKGILALFLKIQFLECENRKNLFDMFPPKYVYVLRYRAKLWANGLSFNPTTGKPWANTIAFAWYVWEKNNKSEPIIRWVDEDEITLRPKKLF